MTDMLSTLVSGFGDKALMLVDKDGTPAGHILGTEMVGAMEYEREKSGMRLPAGYQELAYLQSNGGQYINTGVIPDDAIGFYIDAQKTSNNNSGSIIIGCRQDSGNTRCLINIDDANGYGGYFYLGWNGLTSTSEHIPAGLNRFTAKINYKNNRKGIVSDVEYAALNTQLTNTLGTFSQPLYLFGSNNYGSFFYGHVGKIWNVKITSGSDITHDYVPAKRNSDGVVGMYDLVSNTFLTNAGTGTFSYGEL